MNVYCTDRQWSNEDNGVLGIIVQTNTCPITKRIKGLKVGDCVLFRLVGEYKEQHYYIHWYMVIEGIQKGIKEIKEIYGDKMNKDWNYLLKGEIRAVQTPIHFDCISLLKRYTGKEELYQFHEGDKEDILKRMGYGERESY